MLRWLTETLCVTRISFQSLASRQSPLLSFPRPFCFWFLPLSLCLVFPLSPLVSFLCHLHLLFLPSSWCYHRPQLHPSLHCLPVWRAEAPAEGDILTVSCYTANKRTFLNDELLLCKWPLTDTVSARHDPEVQWTTAAAEADSDHFHDCGARRGEVTGGLRWMRRSVYCGGTDLHTENTA